MTAPRRPWLRPVFGVLCAAALVSPAFAARPAPVKVLIATPVADDARTVMPPALWGKLVANYVNADVVPFTGSGTPTLTDCKKIEASYLVVAPFDLRPRLPGLPSGEGVTLGRTRITVTNCLTGTQVYDQAVALESDPPSTSSAGDFEPDPTVSWNRSVPSALARFPVFFPHVARVVQVQPPFAYVDVSGTVSPGDALRVFADAKHNAKGPIVLTVTQTAGKFVQTYFSTVNGGPIPSVGDLVEPAPRAVPAVSPT